MRRSCGDIGWSSTICFVCSAFSPIRCASDAQALDLLVAEATGVDDERLGLLVALLLEHGLVDQVLERIDHHAAAADHQLGITGLDLEHRLVGVVLDVDVRRDSHALEHAEQELARLLGEVFTIRIVCVTAASITLSLALLLALGTVGIRRAPGFAALRAGLSSSSSPSSSSASIFDLAFFAVRDRRLGLARRGLRPAPL